MNSPFGYQRQRHHRRLHVTGKNPSAAPEHRLYRGVLECIPHDRQGNSPEIDGAVVFRFRIHPYYPSTVPGSLANFTRRPGSAIQIQEEPGRNGSIPHRKIRTIGRLPRCYSIRLQDLGLLTGQRKGNVTVSRRRAQLGSTGGNHDELTPVNRIGCRRSKAGGRELGLPQHRS